jgi:thiamine biosynthesis lipoprotein
MGTEFCLYLAQADEAEGRAVFQAVFEEIDRVEATFSRFLPSSEISRLNRLAAQGPVVTDPEVFRLLTEAQALWQKTGGVFDVALGRLSRAWGFAERAPHLPEAEALAEATAAAGMALVELDAEWRTVRFLQPGVELDLGAFAKGYAVDCALAVLRQAGVAGLIDAGSSSIAAVGEPFESGWRVAVPNPAETAGNCLAELTLGSRALSSSGIMEQKFQQDGRTYSHLLDPRKMVGSSEGETAAPVSAQAEAVAADRRQLLQATVLAPTSALADALSTAMFLLGPEQGAAVLDQFEDCAALWVFSGPAGVGWQDHHWPLGGVLPWGESNHG